MADTPRLKSLRRIASQQGWLRDRMLAARAELVAQELGISARERDVLSVLDTGECGALHGLMLAGAARRLESLARERAALQARIAAADATAAHHARLARAGEKRLEALAREMLVRDERAALEGLLDARTRQPGTSPAS